MSEVPLYLLLVLRVQGSGFRVQGSEFRVQGVGYLLLVPRVMLRLLLSRRSRSQLPHTIVNLLFTNTYQDIKFTVL